MMTAQAPTWMFEPVATMSPEQWRRWYRRCYSENDVDELLRDPVRSMVVSTYPGCGITTSLQRLHSLDLLVFPYNPDQWPGQAHPFTRAESHFEQWMAHIAYALSEELREHQGWCARLTLSQHQFLDWLLQRYLGRRQSLVWRDFLQASLSSEAWEGLAGLIAQEPIEYGETIADLKYQIHECLAVARALGRRAIFASIDLSWWDWVGRSLEERKSLDAQLRQLLITLAPLEVPSFGVKLGVPARLLPPQELDRLSRARVRPSIYPAAYRWSDAQLYQTCAALVDLAAEEMGAPLPPPPRELWDELRGDLASIWGAAGPAAATAIARVWVSLVAQELADAARLQALRVGLYRQAAPLRLLSEAEGQTVLRGVTEIPLDDMPFRIFQLLWRHRGSPAGNDVLLQVAGTKANLDKLISRLREQIEPLYRTGEFIYLQRRQNSGTWLEKDVCLFIDKN